MFGGSVSPTLPPTIKTINERNRIAPVPTPSAAPGERACDAPRRSGCTEPSGAALSGGCESSCASSYRRRRAGAPRPIGWRRRHSCFVEPRAFGRRSCRTRQCGQHCGSDRSRRRQWLCGFKLRRSAVKAGLKPLFGLQAKYPNQLNGHQPIIRRADLGAAGINYRALVGPSVPLQKRRQKCAAD
jgi:hypothetical protein